MTKEEGKEKKVFATKRVRENEKGEGAKEFLVRNEQKKGEGLCWTGHPIPPLIRHCKESVSLSIYTEFT